MAPGLWDPVVPGGAEPPRIEVGAVPSDVGVAGGQLVQVQHPGVVGADCRVVVEWDLSPGNRARPGPERHYVLPEPRRASALVHHQVSRVFRLVLQCVHRHVSVVWHLRSHQQGGAGGGPRGLGWPAPTCTITQSARSCASSVAQAHWLSVVTHHTGVGAWARGHRGSGHTTSALGFLCSPSASTSRRMYRRATGGWYAAPCVGRDRLP